MFENKLIDVKEGRVIAGERERERDMHETTEEG